MSERPNVIYFQVDNLGYGELGCYGGGVLRGAETRRIDKFAREGTQLLNFAPEAQCTPSRSALMTGRHAIRSGNHTVALAGAGSGLVAWERTISALLSDAGYATSCLGKWHIGDREGSWPTDHGFDEWYGPPHTYDEAMWEKDPWYRKGRDPESHLLESRKGEQVRMVKPLTYEVKRNIDLEYLDRATSFIAHNAEEGRAFFLYFNHSLMHIPVVPRDEYSGKSGQGDWADCLLQLDGDFGRLLDKLEELGLADNTIVIFAGDNGNEEMLLHRGTGGFFEGSYFTGMEASLRTPCIVRWPGKIPAQRKSNEIVHITDWFPTLAAMTGQSFPNDRELDGVDQSAFLTGGQDTSNREGFIFWNGERMHGVKWQNFKLVMVKQKYFTDAAETLGFPHIVNLMTDPKEREPFNQQYFHSWTMAHFGRMLAGWGQSIAREPPIPTGAPVDHVPRRSG